MIRSLNIWFVAWSLLAFLCASGGYAQDEKRVAVLTFTGPSAAAAQAQVTQGLKQRPEVELVSAREVKSTASRLGNSLQTASDFQEVGEALEVSAFVEGEVAKRGRGLQINVRVRNASTGEVVHEQTWVKRRSQMKTLKAVAWKALGPAISESSAPSPKAKPKPKPKPVEEEPLEEEEEEEEEAPPPRPRPRPRPPAKPEEEREPEQEEEEPAKVPGDKSVKHPALVASAGPRIMWRTLSYEGATNLNSYKSTDGGTPAFNLTLSAQYFPGAHVSAAWYSDLGLDLDLDYALGLKSNLAGEELKTTAYELGLGAIYRVPLDAFELRFRAGYVKQVFEVDVPESTLLPAIDYGFVRLGPEPAIHFVDWLTFDASFAYLLVLSAGELEDPRYGEDVRTTAWEAGAGFLLRLKEVFGVRLGLDYRRYKYDFGLSDSELLTDLPTSGTDSYLRLTAAFVYTLPGAAVK